MRKLRLSILLFVYIFVIGYSAVNAQSVTPTTFNVSGGTALINTVRFDWSFGEAMAVNTMDNGSPTIVVTNGILQTGTENPTRTHDFSFWAPDEIKILPNPTPGQVEINVLSKQKGKLHMRLFNQLGQLLTSTQFDYNGFGHIEHWQLQQYASGQYFLIIELVPAPGSTAKKGSFNIQKLN